MQATEPVPADLVDLLTSNVPAHITYSRPDGSLVTNVMWVDFDGQHVLTSSMVGSYKGRAFRARPQVAISLVDPASQWRRLSISGRVTDIRPDEGLAFINKLSQRYTGQPYARTNPREIFTITPDRVRAFAGRG
jgi:PPOX class probable F420-dependent enzyme